MMEFPAVVGCSSPTRRGIVDPPGPALVHVTHAGWDVGPILRCHQLTIVVGVAEMRPCISPLRNRAASCICMPITTLIDLEGTIGERELLVSRVDMQVWPVCICLVARRDEVPIQSTVPHDSREVGFMRSSWLPWSAVLKICALPGLAPAQARPAVHGDPHVVECALKRCRKKVHNSNLYSSKVGAMFTI